MPQTDTVSETEAQAEPDADNENQALVENDEVPEGDFVEATVPMLFTEAQALSEATEAELLSEKILDTDAAVDALTTGLLLVDVVKDPEEDTVQHFV